jgi:hypothetical protein
MTIAMRQEADGRPCRVPKALKRGVQRQHYRGNPLNSGVESLVDLYPLRCFLVSVHLNQCHASYFTLMSLMQCGFLQQANGLLAAHPTASCNTLPFPRRFYHIFCDSSSTLAFGATSTMSKAIVCRVNGSAARTGAPGIAADLLDTLHGAISHDKIASLRSKLGFFDLDRFTPSSHHSHADLQYSPQSRAVQWGGPTGISPAQVRCREGLATIVATLLLHCCYIVATLLLHCCYNCCYNCFLNHKHLAVSISATTTALAAAATTPLYFCRTSTCRASAVQFTVIM